MTTPPRVLCSSPQPLYWRDIHFIPSTGKAASDILVAAGCCAESTGLPLGDLSLLTQGSRGPHLWPGGISHPQSSRQRHRGVTSVCGPFAGDRTSLVPTEACVTPKWQHLSALGKDDPCAQGALGGRPELWEGCREPGGGVPKAFWRRWR